MKVTRYIDADKLCELARNSIDKKVDANDIMRFPISDVQEVRHSSWHCANVRMSSRDINCRYCHRTETISNGENFEYCPHCGAKMDGDDDEAKFKELEEKK